MAQPSSSMDTDTGIWSFSADVSLQGYSEEWLKPGQLDQVSARCCLCNKIPRNAMACDCAHVYCEHCLDVLKVKHDSGEENILCLYKPPPNSMELDEDEPHNLNFSDPSPERIVRKLIKRLLAVCPHDCKTDGLSLGTVEEHMKGCKHRPVACPHCDKTLKARELSEHTLECQRKQHTETNAISYSLKCRYCAADFQNDRQLQEHQPICPQKKSACPVCKEQISKQDTHHANRCRAVCPLQCLEDKVVRVLQHLSDKSLQGVHATQLVNKLLVIEEKLELKMNEKPHQNRIFQDSIADIETELREIWKTMVSNEAVANVNQLVTMADDVKTSKKRVGELDTLVKVLTKDVIKFGSKIQTIENVQARLDEYQASIDKKVRDFKNNHKLIEAKILEARRLGDQVQQISYSGRLIWKITDFSKNLEASRLSSVHSMYSPPFYTHPFGYKMRARVVLYGQGRARGVFLSLYFMLVKGEYDDLLTWPFTRKVALRVKNLKDSSGKTDIEQRFRPDSLSVAFKRPESNMNNAVGIQNFISHTELNKHDDELIQYQRDDTIYIEVLVENDSSARPRIFPAMASH